MKAAKSEISNDLITRKKIVLLYGDTLTRPIMETILQCILICQLCLNQKKKNDILSKIKGKQRQKMKNDKTEKAVSLLISCDTRNSYLNVVLGLQNLPYYTQRNPIQEETKNPFLLMIFEGEENNIFTYMFTNICIK